MSQAGAITTEGGLSTLEIDADIGSAISVAGVINILGGSGVTTSAAGNTVIINVVGTGFKWNVVTSVDNPVVLSPENGYITKGAGQVQFELPPAATVGDSYKVVGYGNLWTISQNANQNITLGIVTSTTGVLGSITATSIKDCVDLTNVTTNLEWIITDSVGNPTVV